jgi:DNA repair exonuclease SbcCD ATPase subunit
MPRRAPAAITEDFGSQLHEAQEKLLELRQQQELLERQRNDLEELRAKQDRFLKGRVDVTERLTKGLTRLDRDTFQSRKRLEMLEHAKENFAKHLDAIESMNPEHWSRADLRNELVRATAALEDAEQDYAEAMARLGMVGGLSAAEEDGSAAPARPAFVLPGFRYWFNAGLAFTLPVLALASLALLLHHLLR